MCAFLKDFKMLLRFKVKNHLSIAEDQEISFMATKLSGPESGIINNHENTFGKILPSSIIYGANASGKTSFVKAFNFMKNAVLRSHVDGDPMGGVPRQPFLLSKNKTGEESRFEVDFIVKNIRYNYGFSCNNNQFTREWLYSFPELRPRKIFEREEMIVSFGPSLKGAKQTLVEFMRPNSLFISTAIQFNNEYLNDIVSFFKNSSFTGSVVVSDTQVNQGFKDAEIDTRIVKFLNLIGVGVKSAKRTNIEITEQEKEKNLKFFSAINEIWGGSKISENTIVNSMRTSEIKLGHIGDDGDEYFIDLSNESSGTRRLLIIMKLIFIALDFGSLVVIDEIDSCLHTSAVELIIQMFSDKDVNKYGAQLLATTHDTNLLLSQFLRRDQIWFCEKSYVGASHIFSLSDMKTRIDDNFEKGYLQGRYGAIPFSGSAIEIFNKIEE